MKNSAITLSQKLYKLQCESRNLQWENKTLEEKLQENEENIVSAMMVCTELYELLLIGESTYQYAEGGVVELSSAMVKIYVNLIKRGLKTLDEVPEVIREEVEAAL